MPEIQFVAWRPADRPYLRGLCHVHVKYLVRAPPQRGIDNGLNLVRPCLGLPFVRIRAFDNAR